MSDAAGPDWPGRKPGDPVDELVASYLAIDIQRSPQWANELHDRVQQVIAGTLPRWVRLGNAYQLTLARERCTIEALAGPDEGHEAEVPAATMLAAVSAWRDLVNEDEDSP